VFENVSGWELIVIVLAGLFIIGPERLPKVLSDTMRVLRNVRTMARNATSDLSRELGTTIELEDLHPKTFLRKHLLSESEEAELRRPFQDLYSEVRAGADQFDLSKELSDSDAAARQKPDLQKSPAKTNTAPPIDYDAT
jgi:sec-independent protein translocase protein TatB